MMLRRLKEDVEKNLAPKEETIIEVEPFYQNSSDSAVAKQSKYNKRGGGDIKPTSVLATLEFGIKMI